MLWLRHSSIQRRMTMITLAICGVVLLVATGALFTFQLFIFRQNFVRDLTVLTESIAENSVAPLMMHSRKDAEEVLGALRAKPQVVSAWLQLPDGSVYARYGAQPAGNIPQILPVGGPRFDGGYVLHAKRVTHRGEEVGTLFLRSDYGKVFHELIRLYLVIFGLVLVVSISLAFVLSSRLQSIVTEPILALAGTAREVAEKKDYSVRARKAADDELGVFTDTFNQMLAQIQTQDASLQQAQQRLATQVEALQHEIAERKSAEAKLSALHQELLEVSRQAGMAEVATSVLHNVGNVLNSLNVSVTLLQDRVRVSKADNLAKVVELMDEHGADLGTFMVSHPKGQVIPKYLRQLATHLSKERRQILQEVEAVGKNLDHVKEIVAMQQNYAKAAGVLETLPAATLMEDALQLNVSSLERDGITLQRQYAEVPDLTVDKHKALQILVNLIRNARSALKESQRPDKLLQLGIALNGGGSLKLTVTDNGIGIPPENLTRIFSHGFTTKKHGHGFGLHSGALAANEMGGSLMAQSDGLGRGATFTLELPLNYRGGNT